MCIRDRSKPEPEKTATKKTSSSKPPRVIITTTGGKKMEIGKKTAPAKTVAKKETPKPREEPVKDVTKSSSAKDNEAPMKGEFKEDDDDKTVSAEKSKSIEVLPANGGWEIVKIGGRDYVTAESIRNFYNPVYGFTTFRTQGTHFLSLIHI